MTIVYGFRAGSNGFPRSIEGPFMTLQEARLAADREHAMGEKTGRVRKVSTDDFQRAVAALREGILPRGW